MAESEKKLTLEDHCDTLKNSDMSASVRLPSYPSPVASETETMPRSQLQFTRVELGQSQGSIPLPLSMSQLRPSALANTILVSEPRY